MTCPDEGRCWHDCEILRAGRCWRVENAAPYLSYIDGEGWSDADRARHCGARLFSIPEGEPCRTPILALAGVEAGTDTAIVTAWATRPASHGLPSADEVLDWLVSSAVAHVPADSQSVRRGAQAFLREAAKEAEYLVPWFKIEKHVWRRDSEVQVWSQGERA